MRKHYIDIVGKWAFIFAYDIGMTDLDEIGDWLEALGASDNEIRQASRVILETNKGFTYSNTNLRMSVMCISDATDISQWWDSVVHEIDHLQSSILEYYDVDEGTEDAAWLQGFIMRKIVSVLKQESPRHLL